MLSRRAMLGKVAAAAGAAVVVGAGRAMASATQTPPAELDDAPRGKREHDGGDAAVSSPPPWDLLSPLALGSVVAHGWRLADLSPVSDGACVVTLRDARGRSHRIHICLNDGSPQGILYTRRLDLVVMNGGQGAFPTEEGLAQAVAEVAHVLAANEANGEPERFAAQLLPHGERLRRFALADCGLR
jgi:hypothetical protein